MPGAGCDQGANHDATTSATLAVSGPAGTSAEAEDGNRGMARSILRRVYFPRGELALCRHGTWYMGIFNTSYAVASYRWRIALRSWTARDVAR